MDTEPGARRWAITTHARRVSKPWEIDPTSSSRTVQREANVKPAAGPLARYLRHFPQRRVLWNVAHQLFEVRERDPYTGLDFRVCLVFEYESPPERSERARSPEEWAAMQAADAKGPKRHLQKVFRPFDDQYVNERIEDDYRNRHEGVGALSRRIRRHNEAIVKKKELERRNRMKDFLKSERRWLGVLASMHAGNRKSIALTEKVPLITPGIVLGGRK